MRFSGEKRKLTRLLEKNDQIASSKVHVPFAFIFPALQVFTSPNYEASARVSSLAAGQFDFFFFSRNNAQLAGCPSLAISISPGSGDPDLLVSNRPFTASGACSSVSGTYCQTSSSSGMDTITLPSSQTSFTGYFYVAVKAFGSSPAVYTLSLTWRGSSGACCMFQIATVVHRPIYACIVIIQMEIRFQF